jgi:gluconokinase
VIIIVMGVLGAGKTTVGSLLARELGFEFHDADSFHSPANIEKMRQGIPLTDSDREPWLAAMHSAITLWMGETRDIVLACSALKASYRGQLVINDAVKLVYLNISFDDVLQRVRVRHGHFAGENLLKSQFADLEEPANALTVDASLPPEEIVSKLQLRLRNPV